MNSIESNAWLALIAAIAYIVGSFPTAYFVTKGMSKKDIRFEGSHNVGAMNAYSLIKSNRSEKLAATGLVTILFTDMGKGVLAIYVVRWLALLGYNHQAALIIGSLFVILGHNYPFCFKFREGGIGFATFMGVLLALKAPALPIWVGTMLLAIFVAEYIQVRKWNLTSLSKIISIIGTQLPGRLAGLGIALVPLYFFNPRLLFPVLAATVLILIKHTDSIKALVRASKSR
ncbi:unnamed protein product [marine sediment metagenome]|uniref:Uncharacterized protein n=1 Tax=marine sediment metagenome TaxID=412755 RepID=X0SHT7_9ZZZZ